MLLTGRVVTPAGVVDDGVVVVVDDRISWVGPRRDLGERAGAEPDGWAAGRTLLPGLVDLHCHGGAGGEFGADADAGRDRRAAPPPSRHHLAGRLAGLGPAGRCSSTASPRAPRLVDDGTLAGIHLEGPFLSVARCGAQDPSALVDPDPALVEALTEAGRGAWSR